MFAIFQCESTKGGEQRVLQFAVVISFDSVSLLIFLLQRQIRRLHNILTLDIEQGHIGAEGIGDISATAVDRGHGQHEQRDSSARPEMRQVMPEYGYDGNQVGRLSIRSIGAETPRLDRVAGQPGGLATDGGRSGLGADGGEPSRRFAEIPRYNGWGGRMAHSMPAGQEQGRVDQQPGRPDRRSAYSIPVGIDPGFGGIQSPCISPATIIDNSQHPALRSAHDTSQPMPRDGFHTPPEVPSPLETDAPGQLHF